MVYVPIVVPVGGNSLGVLLGIIIAYGLIFGFITILYRDVCGKIARIVGMISFIGALIALGYVIYQLITLI